MYELLSKQNLQLLAYEYTEDEATTVIFASETFCFNQSYKIIKNNDYYLSVNGIEHVLEQTLRELHSGSRVVLPYIHNLILHSSINFLCYTFVFITDDEMLQDLCMALDVSEEALVYRSLKASRLIGEDDTKYKLI